MDDRKPDARLMAVCLITMYTIGTAGVRAGDWPAFRGPQHNGVLQTSLDVLDEPEEIWRFDRLGILQRGAATIVGDRLFINGGRQEDRSEPFLHCLNAGTGAEIWKSRAGRTHSTPAVHDGRVYVQDDRLMVRCFDAATGDEIWTQQMPESTERRGWGHSASPRVWEDLVIVNYGAGAALNLKTGEPAWKFEGFAGLATPVIFTFRNRPAVAIFSGNRMIVRDPRTGAELWSIPWVTKSGVNACDPLFLKNDSQVYLSSKYGLGRTLYNINDGNPQEVWTFDNGSTYSSSVFLDGKLFTLNGSLGQLDLSDGRQIARGPAGHSMLVIDDHFILLSGDGELRIGQMIGDRFRESMRARVLDGQTWNVPAYANGRLYVRNHDGVLVCVQIGKES